MVKLSNFDGKTMKLNIIEIEYYLWIIPKTNHYYNMKMHELGDIYSAYPLNF